MTGGSLSCSANSYRGDVKLVLLLPIRIKSSTRSLKLATFLFHGQPICRAAIPYTLSRAIYSIALNSWLNEPG